MNADAVAIQRRTFWTPILERWPALPELWPRFKAWAHERPALVTVGASAALLTLLPFVWLLGHVYFDRSNLPDLGALLRFEAPTIGTVRDSNGEVLIELAHEYRRVVSYEQVPPILVNAVLAAEDKRFFEHSGVDLRALPRVVQKSARRTFGEWRRGNGLSLRMPQGGSTITQQLVRVYFLRELTSRPDDSAVFHSGFGPPRLLAMALGAHAANKLMRKLEEVRLAFWLEEELERIYGSREKAKQEIFARYASFIYLGDGRYGYEAAAEHYLGKSLAEMAPDDAAGAAMLASIGKAPESYAPQPAKDNGRLIDRRNEILGLMAKNGYIDAGLASRCRAKPIALAEDKAEKTAAPAAVDHVLEELKEIEGGRFEIADLLQGRIVVASTVDLRIQTIVNEALEKGLEAYEKRHPAARGSLQGSVVVLANDDAAILAEAGGRKVFKQRDSRYSDYNRVIDSLRQPGSAMKPLVYLAALEAGYSLDSLVPDEPIEVPMGDGETFKSIDNYDYEYKGEIPLRQALAESRNTVAVWLAREVGMRRVLHVAREMGIKSPLEPNLATALGASEVRLLELADAYRAIASGLHAEPHVIARVSDSGGRRLYEAPGQGKMIDSPALAALQEGLRGSVRLPGGTARVLDRRREFPLAVMGKTGTTSEHRDALFVGSTYGVDGITVAVRVGFDDNRPLGEQETGGKVALPIFREILLRIHQQELHGKTPRFPREIETGIDAYLAAAENPLAELMPAVLGGAPEEVVGTPAAGMGPKKEPLPAGGPGSGRL
jgi:penicillin-binding protein 1A